MDWIKINDLYSKKPSEFTKVKIFADIQETGMRIGGEYLDLWINSSGYVVFPTHWSELDEPPKE